MCVDIYIHTCIYIYMYIYLKAMGAVWLKVCKLFM